MGGAASRPESSACPSELAVEDCRRVQPAAWPQSATECRSEGAWAHARDAASSERHRSRDQGAINGSVRAMSTPPSSEPMRRGSVASRAGGGRWLVRLGLAAAILAMGVLHILQPELDPAQEPVSFYLHGRGGMWLMVALVAFGLAALRLSGMHPWPRGSRRLLNAFGLGLILTALVPSDRWFPWEQSPTWHGVVHAALAVVVPLLLIWPIIAHVRASVSSQRAYGRVVMVGYIAALAACGLSLAVGFHGDRSPPLIGLAERILALAAVSWVYLATTGPTTVEKRESTSAGDRET